MRESRPSARRCLGVGLIALLWILPVILPLEAQEESEIRLEIYPTQESRIPIGVETFASEIAREGLSREVTELVKSLLEKDLEFSLYFRLVQGPPGAFGRGTAPRVEDREALLAGWNDRGARFLVDGVVREQEGGLEVALRVTSLQSRKEILYREYHTHMGSLRWTAHGMSDDVVGIVTGEKGISQTAIAFLSEKGGIKEISLMDYDGYNVRQLTQHRSIVLSPAWSPDGGRIAYTSFKDNNPNLYVRDLKKGTDTRLLSFPGINSAPAWSPDGQFLAVTLSKDGASELYRYDYRSSVLRRLTFSQSIDTSPSWSPNGQQIVFTSDRTGSPKLYVMDADGSNLRPLTTSTPYGQPYNDTPIWSPVGDRIAFVSRERREVFNLYSLDIVSGRLQQLTAVGQNTHPSWSPDGLHIVFCSSRDGQDEIYVMNWDGTGVKRLTFTGGNSSPAWSPRLKTAEGGNGT